MTPERIAQLRNGNRDWALEEALLEIERLQSDYKDEDDKKAPGVEPDERVERYISELKYKAIVEGISIDRNSALLPALLLIFRELARLRVDAGL